MAADGRNPTGRRRPRRKLLIDVADLQIVAVPAEGAAKGEGALPARAVCEALAEAFWDWHCRKAAAERNGEDGKPNKCHE